MPLPQLPRIQEAFIDETRGDAPDAPEVHDRLEWLMREMGAREVRRILPPEVRGDSRGNAIHNNDPGRSDWYRPPFGLGTRSAYAYAAETREQPMSFVRFGYLSYTQVRNKQDLERCSTQASTRKYPFSLLPDKPFRDEQRRTLVLSADLFLPDLSPYVKQLMEKIGREVRATLVVAAPWCQWQCEEAIQSIPCGSIPHFNPRRVQLSHVSEASYAPYPFLFERDLPLPVDEWTVFATTNQDVHEAIRGSRGRTLELISGIQGSFDISHETYMRPLLTGARMHQSFGEDVNFEGVSPKGLVWSPEPVPRRQEDGTRRGNRRRNRRRRGDREDDVLSDRHVQDAMRLWDY